MAPRTTRSLRPLAAGWAALAVLGVGAAFGQRTDVFVASRDHPAIAWTTAPLHDVVTELNQRIATGSVQLAFDASTGYLRSTLEALKMPAASQVLVFSGTSAQAERINPKNPRAIYFNDTAFVGWVRGADALELAAVDPRQGVSFYTLRQTPAQKPQFQRDNSCLLCHATWETLGVPGVMVLTTFPMSDDPNAYASGFVTDHRTPIDQRFGGWYVTGTAGTAQHQGNVPVVVPAAELEKKRGRAPELQTVDGRFDTAGFVTHYSDAAALMVLEHQTHMTNLLTRAGWEARVAAADGPSAGGGATGGVPARVAEAASDLVDYLLFVDEAPLPGPVTGASGFAEAFSAGGPRDGRGRSLRQLDLKSRLMRYPCSYMIYAPSFDALPQIAKDAVYQRAWHILSGQEKDKRYARLSRADREAIVEILRDTKKDLPAYFRGVSQ